jgi:transposase
MTEGSNNPTDRGKLGTKRHILTDKNCIPLSVVMSPASTHDIRAVTDVMDDMVIRRSSPSTKCNSSRKRKLQHLCLDKAYNSRMVKQAIIKRGYVPHIPYKRSRGQKIGAIRQKKYPSAKNRRWVVERTNS